MATPHVSDFQGAGHTNSRSSKRAKLDVPSEETERNRGIGPESNTALGKQRATFHFFKDFPLDILGEIFWYLEPLELLHLSWTDKILRSFLLNRASAPFWRRSLTAVEDLPPCPKDLSEPQYTSLMLTEYCHACLRGSQSLFMYLEARTQLCRQCSCKESQSYIIGRFKRWTHLPKQIDESLADIIPATTQPLTAKERKQRTESKRVERTRFHVKTALKLDEELGKIRSKKQKAIWLAEKQAELKGIEEHTAAFEQYFHRQDQKQREYQRNRPHRRENSIREKLIEQGWEEELQYSPHFLKEKFWHLLHKSQEFTQREWNQVKELVIAEVQRKRVIRILGQKRMRLIQRANLLVQPAYQAHIFSQLPNTIIPSFGDLLMTQDFSPIVEMASLGQDIPSAMRDAALRKIPEIFTNWRNDQEEALLDIIRQSSIYSGQDVSKETLLYATTLFICTQCSESLAYPAVIFHECFVKSCSQFHRTVGYNVLSYKKREPILNATDPDTVSAVDLVRIAYGDPDWWSSGLPALFGSPPSAPSDVLQFNTAGYHHIAAILDCLSMGRTTTTNALRTLDPYVMCHCECYGQRGLGKAMRWMRAITGCKTHRFGNYDNAFSSVDEKEVPHLPTHAIEFFGDTTLKLCPLCHVSVGSFHFNDDNDDLYSHLRQIHRFSVNDTEKFVAILA